MEIGKIEQLTTDAIAVIEERKQAVDDASLRSIEISQMRLLARKRPREYVRVMQQEIDVDKLRKSSP